MARHCYCWHEWQRKTTLLQLCSSAYVKEKGGRVYKIGEWVRSALQDETPAVDAGSSVSFSFWDDSPTLPIHYQKERTRWGYPRRNNPQRNVEFIGIATFAPRIERKDRLHVFQTQIQVKGRTAFSDVLLKSISAVLGTPYLAGAMTTVGPVRGDWEDILPQITKGDAIYAEPHMGAGEQKVIRLIQALEEIPKRSLILLEEPEITLHPDAQRGLAWYLMSLARRNGHQIVVATHSADLFETLPREARILLLRHKDGVEAIPRPPRLLIARELAGATRLNKDVILVEDTVARSFMLEVLRQHDKHLLDNCSIIPVGNTDDVYRLTQKFRAEGLRPIGVRDPDIGGDIAAGILSLPGDLAPESLLLEEANILAASNLLNGVEDSFQRAKVQGLGLEGTQSLWAKTVFIGLAQQMGISAELLSDRLTLAWLMREGHALKAQQLVEQIKAALG